MFVLLGFLANRLQPFFGKKCHHVLPFSIRTEYERLSRVVMGRTKI